MAETGSDAAPIFGYLHTVEESHHGHTGGLLLVCHRGRPLEFHCTEPVLPSRAQQILFGPTLRPYLLGELLGETLLAKATLPVSMLLVSDPDALGAGRAVGAPAVALDPRGEPLGELTAEQRAWLALLARSIDPAEPFERVSEAVHEALRLVAGDSGVSPAGPPEGETRDAA